MFEFLRRVFSRCKKQEWVPWHSSAAGLGGKSIGPEATDRIVAKFFFRVSLSR